MKGSTREAIDLLERARRLWQELDLPYEVARTRFALALAHRRAGNEASAELELRAALSVFERLGADPDVRRTRELLTSPDRARRTLMFTDIVGSTELLAVIGDEAWEHLLRWHDQTLRALFVAHGGREVDHAGDGFFVSFDDREGAVTCAIAIQRSLADHRRRSGFAPRVRIGLHAGEVSGSHRGLAVHEAARIGSLAEGGEILTSRTTVAGLALAVSPPRTVSLEGIGEPVEVVSVEWR